MNKAAEERAESFRSTLADPEFDADVVRTFGCFAKVGTAWQALPALPPGGNGNLAGGFDAVAAAEQSDVIYIANAGIFWN